MLEHGLPSAKEKKLDLKIPDSDMRLEKIKSVAKNCDDPAIKLLGHLGMSDAIIAMAERILRKPEQASHGDVARCEYILRLVTSSRD